MIELVINEHIQDLERSLLMELQKQMPKRIISSMIMMELDDHKVVLANFGKVPDWIE